VGAATLRPLDRPGDLGWVVGRHGTTANLEVAGRPYDAFGFRTFREEREKAFGTEVLSRHMALDLG
jgi:hypothetical protein